MSLMNAPLEIGRVRGGSERHRTRGRGVQESLDIFQDPVAADASKAGRLLHLALQALLGGRDDPGTQQVN